MKTSVRSRAVAGLAAILLLAASGCINPFDPKANVRLWRFEVNGNATQLVVQIVQANAINLIAGPPTVSAVVLNESTSVGVIFDSYTVVYRQNAAQTGTCTQPPGSPICSLGGAAGRRFALHWHLAPVNTNPVGSGGATTAWTSLSLPLSVITAELLQYIASNQTTINGGIDMDITLSGTDHNGHDVKAGGTCHIEIF